MQTQYAKRASSGAFSKQMVSCAERFNMMLLKELGL
jgi:hypothetical protein